MLISPLAINVYADEETYLADIKNYKLMNVTENTRPTVVTKSELDDLIEKNMVNYYEPNYEVHLFSDYWNLDTIESDFPWKLGCFGNDIKIAVIDSGIRDYESIKDNILTGYDYLCKTTDTRDYIGHGTFVSGIIASETYGLAYKSKIVPLKCFDKNKKTELDDILPAIYDAVDKYDCKIINMSFGLDENEDSLYLKQAIDYAANKGKILVAAAGNEGSERYVYPASYDNVISVGSVKSNKNISSFSQHNDKIAVVAPGESLKSLSIIGYNDNKGTSFSAPHVTAAAAIALNIRDLNCEEFMEILKITSIDGGDEGYDNYYGYGILNVKNIVNELIGNNKFFVSPISQDENSSKLTIYNNSNESQDIICICKSKNLSGIFNINAKSVSLNVYDSYTFSSDKYDGESTFMFWNNLTDIVPVTNKKFIVNQQ